MTNESPNTAEESAGLDVSNDVNIQFMFDVPEEKRHLLSESDIEYLITMELASEGILRPKAPQLTPVPEKPKLETMRRWFVQVDTTRIDAAFETEADARNAVEALQVAKDGVERRYLGASYYRSAELVKFGEPPEVTIMAVELPTPDSFSQSKEILDRISEIEAENKSRTEVYEGQLKKVNKVSSEVWDTYHAACREAKRLDELREEWAEFVKLARGDEGIAWGFIRKRRSVEELKEAGINVPVEIDALKAEIEEVLADD